MEKFNLITNSAVELGDDLSTETNGKGRKFVSKFIEPGVAHYEQFGDVLITKETLNKFINTMVGCPVIIKHKDITDENADKERVGVVSDVWFNEADGWFYCSGIIWDKQAIDLVKNQGWNVSCTYDFESDKQEKTHNGKKIDMEFTDGEFLHLALVDNPRYERANIVMNSEDKPLFTIYNESDQDLDDTSTERWITIHPNGKDAKGRAVCIPEGKTVSEVMKEKFATWAADSKDQQKLFDVKDYKSGISDYKVEKKTKDLMKKYGDNLDTETAKELIKEKYNYKDFRKKEDKKETYQETIDRLDKKYGVDKNDKGESWYDRASESEIKTDIKTLEHEIDKNTKEIDRLKGLSDDVASKIYGGRDKKIDSLNEQIKRDKEHIEYAKAHLEKKQSKEQENRKTQANYGKEVILKDKSKKGKIVGSVPRGENPDTKEKMYLYEVKWDDGSIERIHSNKVELKDTTKQKKPFNIPSITQSLKQDYEAGKISAHEVAKELSKANLTPYLYDDKDALKKIGIDTKAENALLTGLDEIFDSYTATKEDLPILNGLKDILGE